MSTNYVTKEYLIKNFQKFADKLKTIYQKQENVEFHVVDSYSKLASNPKVSMVSYVINDETIGTDIKEKGFYYYDIKEATPKWIYIEISGGNGLELKPWISGGKDYSKDEYVVYDYKLYQANKNHTSSANFELDKTNWNLIIGGNSYEVFNWKTDHDYVVGNRVKYNNYVYECIADHHSDLTDFDNDKDNWIIELDKYYNVTKKQYDDMVKNGLITASTKHLYVVEGDSSSSGGSGNLTTDLISNVTVGGVSANTKYTKGTSLETIIKDILVKYFPADLVFSLNPSKTLYKISEVVNSIDMIANVTKKSNNIENIKYYIDGTLVDTKDKTTDTGIENGGSYTYTHGTPFSTDTTFKVDVYDGKNTTTKTIKVEFVNPFYCGLASSTLQEILQKKGAYTYNNITCNNDSIVFKYPKSYGTLTSILDSNNFENISAFTRSEEVINSVDYYVYTSAVTTVTNFKFIFKF